MSQTTGIGVARNSLYGVIRFSVSVPVTLLITPFILHKLGNERFAVWALVGTVTAFGLLSDMGISTALTKFVAEFNALGQPSRVSQLVSTSLAVYACTGGVAALVILAAQNVIVAQLLGVPVAFREEAAFLVNASVLILVMALISGTFNAVLVGMQRFDLTNLVLIGCSFADAAGALVVLSLGYGLRGLMVSRLVLAFLVVVLNCGLAKGVVSGLTVNLLLSNKRDFRSVVGYGLNIQVASIARVVYDTVNKLLISLLVSLGAVTFWEIAWRIASQIRGLFQSATLSILPASSDIHAAGHMSKIRWMYYRFIRYILLLALPVHLVGTLCARPFIRIWLGPGYETAAVTLEILLPALFVGLVGLPAYEMLKGIGRVDLCTYISLGMAASNVLSSWILGRLFGYFGVVCGFAIPLVTVSVVNLLVCNACLEASLRDILRVVSWKALALAVASCAIFLAQLYMVVSLLTLGLLSIIYAVVYTVSLYRFGVFDQVDRKYLSVLFPIKGIQRFLSRG